MKFTRLSIIYASTFTLAACGSSSNSPADTADDLKSGEVQFYGAKVAAVEDDLPACDSTRVGQLFYVLNVSEFRFCTIKGYVSIDLSGIDGNDGIDGADGVDGTSCSVKANEDESKTITCTDKTTATIRDGLGCSVVEVTGGYELTCGTSPTVIVKNGQDGTSCTVSDDGAGTLTQTCTDGKTVSWSKAYCGTKAYDPETHFCDVGQSAPMLAWHPRCLIPGNCGTLKDTRETPARIYRWVKIGSQIWMAENLAYLPFVHAESDTASFQPRYYVYNYDGTDVAAAKAESNYKVYGVLYNLPAAMSAGLVGGCPAGWHLPSQAEWSALAAYAGAYGVGNSIGISLKATAGWTPFTGITNTNEFSFTALPSGTNYNGDFVDVGDAGRWWSGTKYSDSTAYALYMDYKSKSSLAYYSLRSGFAVRCLQD